MQIKVASFTDAWIETCLEGWGNAFVMSHLLQMRGLKRGLSKSDVGTFVASFTDAWIETLVAAYLCVLICVASFTDAWIETRSLRERMELMEVASFTDAWIETS